MVRCTQCGREYYSSQVVWYGMVFPVCRWCYTGHKVERERVPPNVDSLDALLAIYIAQAMLDDASRDEHTFGLDSVTAAGIS